MASSVVSARITEKLRTALAPRFLDVINESANHSVPRNSETHFKVVIVADAFSGESLIARHRRVNAILADELKSGVHALSIIAKTPDQWTASSTVPESPKCLGGSKHN